MRREFYEEWAEERRGSRVAKTGQIDLLRLREARRCEVPTAHMRFRTAEVAISCLYSWHWAPKLLEHLRQEKSVAYASEAGTPLIADPGFDLSRAAAHDGHLVTTAPGPSAALAALTLAGLPTDRFLFAGFLPNTKSARRSHLQALADVPATLVFYESPKRLAAMLSDAADVLGAARSAAYCRELTKKFEEVQRGTLAELVERTRSLTVKGEVVVLIDRAASGSVNQDDIASALRGALQTMSVRDASETVAQAYGLPKRKIYQMALEFDKERDQ